MKYLTLRHWPDVTPLDRALETARRAFRGLTLLILAVSHSGVDTVAAMDGGRGQAHRRKANQAHAAA